MKQGMSRTGKAAILGMALLLAVRLPGWAGEPAGPRWNASLQGGAAYMTRTFDWRDEMMSTFVYPFAGVQFGYQTTEVDSPYAALYGFPNLGVGFGWEGISSLEYKGLSRLDDIFHLYGFAERSLLRGRRFSLDLSFNLGAGLNRAVYDPEKNPLNLNFGSRGLIFVGGGLALRYMLTDKLEAGLAGQFNHYSTGRLAYPNAGLNNPVAILSLRYRNAAPPRRAVRPEPDAAPPRFFHEIYAGCGIHKCAIEWSAFGTTTPWPIFAFGASSNFRYRPHLSTGIAVDLYYASPAFMAYLQEGERVLYGDDAVDSYGNYDPFTAGVGVIQHLHYGRFSGFATVGAYLYRHNGLQDQIGKLYQRIGIKYLLPGRTGLFVAVDCKTHRFSHAAMMELTLGLRFPSRN